MCFICASYLGGDPGETWFSFRWYRRKRRAKAATQCYNFFAHGENGLRIDARSAEVTHLLKAWGSGDQAALGEGQGKTLEANAIIHEVYLRLVDVTHVEWQARAQFFAMAAQMMRRILVDAARARRSHKRGGIAPKVDIDHAAVLSPATDRSVLALDEALTAFSEVAPRQAKVVELRYFGGLTEEQIVAALKISPRTVRRDWDLAKAWLLRELSHNRRATHSP